MTEVLIVDVDDDVDLCMILRESFIMLGVASCIAVHSMPELERVPSVPRDLAVLAHLAGDREAPR